LRALIVDALARGSKGRRVVTVDAIGAGPRTVAGVLEQLGIDVELRVSEDVLERPDLLEGFDALLISAMSIDEATVSRIIRHWRRRRGRRPVVVGGPIASDPGFVERTGADLGIHGEAEPVLERLVREGILERLDTDVLRETCGVVFRAPGVGLVVRPRCPVMTRRMWERYRPSTRVVRSYPLYWAARIYVEVVRGCSNYQFPRLEGVIPRELLPEKPRPGCAYCSVISLWGYARSRSVDLVYEEVKALIDEGVHRIVLSGPDFLDYGRDWLVEPRPLVDPRSPPPNLEALRSLLSRLASIPEVASGEASVMAENAKPGLVTESAAKLLGEYLHGTPIHVGAESGDAALLKRMARPATPREAVEAVRRLRRSGLRPYVYVMYCLPGETDRTVKSTVRLIEALYRAGAEKVTAYRFMPLPGSYLEKLRGLRINCPTPHPVKLKAEEVNIRAKKRLIGARVRALVAGVHPRYKRPVAYPLRHGPVMLLEDEASIGELVEAMITGVKGDHMVTASVAKRLGVVTPTQARREWRAGRRVPRRVGERRRGKASHRGRTKRIRRGGA